MQKVRDPGPAWNRLREELSARGLPLPVESHVGFPSEPDSGRLLFAGESGGTRRGWGGVASVSRSRAIPWRSILRVTRVGYGLGPTAFGEVADTLVELADSERALRIHAELCQPEGPERVDLLRALGARGFAPVAVPRMYSRTVLIDLARPEAELLASFSGTCRRHIRAPGKLGLAVEAISDGRLAGRLEELDTETMSRSGGRVRPIDWPSMLRFVRDEPTLATLVGISRPDAATERDLLGFVLGVRHADTVEYFRAASSRPSDVKAPLLYAPAWEVMRWGQRLGARWFDFGGIASASPINGDATGGIADFKHSFHSDEVVLGGELIYAPSAMLDGVARSASSLLAALNGR